MFFFNISFAVLRPKLKIDLFDVLRPTHQNWPDLIIFITLIEVQFLGGEGKKKYIDHTGLKVMVSYVISRRHFNP